MCLKCEIETATRLEDWKEVRRLAAKADKSEQPEPEPEPAPEPAPEPVESKKS